MNARHLAPNDRTDVAMPQFEQMLASQFARQPKVYGDTRQARRLMRPLPHAQHDRRATRLGLVQVREVEIGVHHQNAFGERACNLFQVGSPHQRIFVRIADDQVLIAAARRAFDCQRELRVERIGDARHHQRDGRRAALGKRSRSQMRLIAERLDGIEHPLTGLLANPAAVAQHVRHRGGCATGAARDFAQSGHDLFTIWDVFSKFAS